MNVLTLIGSLTRDPEMRTVANGRTVTTFAIITERPDPVGVLPPENEYHTLIAWDVLAESTATHLHRGDLVHVTGALHTRAWEDDRHIRHYKTEVIVERVLVIKKVLS